MSIEIDFSYAIDGFFDSVNYYRSENPMDVNNMPPPLVTGITDLTYTDTTAQNGKVYFIRFGSVRGNVEKISEEISIQQKDEFWGSVVSLLHFDDGPSISDSKGILTWSMNGDASISTVEHKFDSGGSLFTGVAASSYAISSQTDKLKFTGTGKITVEFFFKKISSLGNASFVQFVDTASGDIGRRFSFFARAGSSDLILAVYANGETFINAPSSAQLNNWNHFAFVKDGAINTLFVNGINVGRVSNTSKAFGYDFTKIYLGQNGQNSESYNGYIDEFRVTNGVARYIDNFTPPAKKYPNA